MFLSFDREENFLVFRLPLFLLAMSGSRGSSLCFNLGNPAAFQMIVHLELRMPGCKVHVEI